MMKTEVNEKSDVKKAEEESEICPENLGTSSEQHEEKTREQTSRGLWDCEGRLFGEKFFFLNKSTTKYVIIGIDPVTFETTLRICDRVTGSHVTITRTNFIHFIDHLRAGISGRNNDGDRYTLHSTLREISIRNIDDLCYLSTDSGTVCLDIISVNNLLRISRFLFFEMMWYTDCKRDYKFFVTELCVKAANLNPEHTLKFLEDSLGGRKFGIEAVVLFNLVAHVDYFITLPFYKEKLFSVQ